VTGFGPASILWAGAAAGILLVTRWVPDIARFRLQPPGDAVSAPAARFRGGSFGLALRTQPRLRGLLLGLGLVHVGMLAGFTSPSASSTSAASPRSPCRRGSRRRDPAMALSRGSSPADPAMLGGSSSTG
jgi:hypothetical protein